MLNSSDENFIKVSYSSLSREALNNLIKDFICREGTDYGEYEVSYEKKAEQVLAQLKRGLCEIYFNKQDQTVEIVSKNI